MGLVSWASKSKGGKITKKDVVVAKNYLTEDEIDKLSKLASMILDDFEDCIEPNDKEKIPMSMQDEDFIEKNDKEKIPMSMQDWVGELNWSLKKHERPILVDKGPISKADANDHAKKEFYKYSEQNNHNDLNKKLEKIIL